MAAPTRSFTPTLSRIRMKIMPALEQMSNYYLPTVFLVWRCLPRRMASEDRDPS
jgi:hypothetical protein